MATRKEIKIFSAKERKMILDFVDENKEVIGSNKSAHVSLYTRREKWQELEKIMKNNGFERNWKQLQSMYQRMKLKAKPAISNYMKYLKGTGGGATLNPLTNEQCRMWKIAFEDFREVQINENGTNNEESLLDQETGYGINSTASIGVKEESLLVPETGSPNAVIAPPAALPIIVSAVSLSKPEAIREMTAYEEEMIKLHRDQIAKQIARDEEVHELIKDQARIKRDYAIFKNDLEIKKFELDLVIAKLQNEKLELEVSNLRNKSRPLERERSQ